MGYVISKSDRRDSMSRQWRKAWMMIGVVLILLLIVNEFTSNPYEKYRAKVKLETYLNEQYPESSFRVTAGDFKRKNESYTFTIVNKNREEQVAEMAIQNGHQYEVIEDQLKK